MEVIINPAKSLSPESQNLLDRWNAAASPLRPSADDIEAMGRGWNAKGGARVLVQGATPELVDLAVRKRAARVIAMDWDASILPAMRCLGLEDWACVESLVCDWRTFVPELESALDLVLGDLSLGMVAFPADWKEVLRLLQRYFVAGGRIVMRLAVKPEEPFYFDEYLGKTVACVETACMGAAPDQRATLMRGLISEVRIALGLASADASGAVDLECRATLTGRCWTELVRRFGHWPEWAMVQPFLKPETEIRKGIRTGRSRPDWESVVSLMEECGFTLRHAEFSGTRPVPGVFRIFAAERI